ncbi:helix-turn-helix domain-containing protein [Micromonospora zhanjiangensis]|uniref:Helix-turn-helix domain-containing protein n=1 Tax=Micromonospora zhanjiangensis TaxID=1522057 RepID=A0ABV8KFC0_9ACTN
MVEQPLFGHRLRQLRRARGLSQAQVAGGRMSASYISLVESGRRTPNADFARLIAGQLGVPLTELVGVAEHRPSERAYRVDLIGRLMSARSARSGGDHRHAAEQLRGIVADASDTEDRDVAWEARWEFAEALGRLGELDEREAVLDALLDDRLTAETAALQTRVLRALAEVSRHRGRLRDSTRIAERARCAGSTLPATAPERVHASVDLLRGYVASGEWEQGIALAEELLAVVDEVPVPTLRGLVHWTAGAMDFLHGKPDAGARFDRALAEIGPDNDVRLWARLLRAAAAHRVAARELDAARPLLARARQAIDLLGRPGDRFRLAVVEIAAALAGGDRTASLSAADELAAQVPDRPPYDRARALVVLARVARRYGEPDDAARHYQEAASRYEECGAYRLAARAWRESTAEPAADDPGPEPDPHALILP